MFNMGYANPAHIISYHIILYFYYIILLPPIKFNYFFLSNLRDVRELPSALHMLMYLSANSASTSVHMIAPLSDYNLSLFTIYQIRIHTICKINIC